MAEARLLGDALKIPGSPYSGGTRAIDAAGKGSFYSDLKAINMLGLNDEFIGNEPLGHFVCIRHDKFDPKYVFSKKPDLIASRVRGNLDLGFGLQLDKVSPSGL